MAKPIHRVNSRVSWLGVWFDVDSSMVFFVGFKRKNAKRGSLAFFIHKTIISRNLFPRAQVNDFDDFAAIFFIDEYRHINRIGFEWYEAIGLGVFGKY